MKQQIISGIKLGFIIAFLLTSYVMYDGIWGLTFFGIQVQEYTEPAYKIKIYEKFQDIRDPSYSKWITNKYIEKQRTRLFCLERKVELKNSNAKEAIDYYYENLKNRNLFDNIKLINGKNIIYFQDYFVDGSIKVINDIPTVVLISVEERR